MNRVQDTEKYHPKLLVSTFQVKVIQGHEVKKVNPKLLGFGGVIHVLGQVVVKNAKNSLRTLSERLNSVKILK